MLRTGIHFQYMHYQYSGGWLVIQGISIPKEASSILNFKASSHKPLAVAKSHQQNNTMHFQVDRQSLFFMEERERDEVHFFLNDLTFKLGMTLCWSLTDVKTSSLYLKLEFTAGPCQFFKDLPSQRIFIITQPLLQKLNTRKMITEEPEKNQAASFELVQPPPHNKCLYADSMKRLVILLKCVYGIEQSYFIDNPTS